MKVLIIEDEKAAVRSLKTVLSQVIPDVEVVAEIDSVSESIEWFTIHPMPELIFMDIHLADGAAFEIFDHTEISCPVIFTTAYDEYALKAFKVNSIDYLLKPIAAEDIKATLVKLKKIRGTRSAESDFLKHIQALKKEESYKTHFLIPVKSDKLLPLAVQMVAYFYISEGIVKVVTTDDKEYPLAQTLDELAESLNPTCFFRANRQYLISRNSIKDVDLWFNNKLIVNLTHPTKEKITVSKARIGAFKEWFMGIAKNPY